MGKSGVFRTVRVMLSCQHIREYTEPGPVKGDTVYCIRCDGVSTVDDAPAEWSVTCRDCPYARRFGASHLAAGSAASRHWQRYMSHVVDMRNGRELVGTFGDEEARAERVSGTRAALRTAFDSGRLFDLGDATGTDGEPPPF